MSQLHAMSTFLLSSLLVASLLLTGGCGLKTPPRPPEATAPVVPGQLRVKVAADGVRVVWSRSKNSADGLPLDDLAGFVVERRDPGSDVWEAKTKIDVTDNNRLRKADKFSWIDRSQPATGSSYRVFAVNADGQAGAPGAEATLSAPVAE